MKRLTLLVVTSALLSLAATARADVKLPAIFGNHMVLQRDAAVPVWGTAAPGEEVTVAIAGQTASAKAGADGKWSVKLAKLAAAGPHTLTVKGKNTVTFSDVLVGEVWLGSGQSNMAMTVNRAKDYEQEQAAAKFPEIRMFTESSAAATTAQTEGKGEWVVCSPETVGRFSATAFFFGREIHRTLKVPVGLINSSVGGTPIESWIAPEAQKASPELKGFFEGQKQAAKDFDPVKAKAKFEQDQAKWKEAAKKAKAEGKPAPKAPRDPVALNERKGNVGHSSPMRFAARSGIRVRRTRRRTRLYSITRSSRCWSTTGGRGGATTFRSRGCSCRTSAAQAATGPPCAKPCSRRWR